jgi:hypothetical protein
MAVAPVVGGSLPQTAKDAPALAHKGFPDKLCRGRAGLVRGRVPRRSQPPRWKPLSIAAAAFAVTAALGSTCLVFALNRPSVGASAVAPSLSRPHLEKARALIAQARLADAEAETLRALAASPVSTEAWLTLAHIRTEQSHRLSEGAHEALRRSYAVDPLAPDAGLWRVRFAFEHWSELDPELRRAAGREVEMRWRIWQKDALRKTADEVSDPTGRMALKLQLAALMRTARY